MVYVVDITTVSQGGEESVAAFLGGFVAAEGSFTRTGRKFRFAVCVAEPDAPLCEAARDALGVGQVFHYGRRRPHYHDEVVFAVQSIRELVHHLVPFMDAYLPASKKRAQYLEWREELLRYWDEEAKRRRPCTIDGCRETRRAKGLCRRHYHSRYGR